MGSQKKIYLCCCCCFFPRTSIRILGQRRLAESQWEEPLGALVATLPIVVCEEMRGVAVLFAYCPGAMFSMASERRVIVPLECWASHKKKLSEVADALLLSVKLETLDAFRGYGPAGLLGIEDWGCILEEAIDSETQELMVLFRTDGGYVRWVEASQVVRRSVAEASLKVKVTGMSEEGIVELMKLYQEAWSYAVKYDLVLDFCPAFYDTIPFENVVSIAEIDEYRARMYREFPFVDVGE